MKRTSGKSMIFFLIILSLYTLQISSFDMNSMNNIDPSKLVSKDSFIEVKETSTDGSRIVGKMKVNGEEYNSICKCEPVSPVQEKLTGPKCDPSKLRIKSEKPGKGANFEQTRNLVGNIEQLNYVSVPEASFKCLDGRNTESGLFTPGGDSGEFLLALMVYEDLLGRHLVQENVDAFFLDYLKYMEQAKFYMCTDDNAINHLEEEMGIEGLNLRAPKLSLVPELLNRIIKPENTGDLHFRLLLKYSTKYHMRQQLVVMFLNAYFKVLWNKEEVLSNRLELGILPGNHRETAFVEVRSEEECQKAKLAPLLSTKDKFISTFTNHLDAVSIRREQLAEFFANKVNHHQDPVDAKLMHARLSHHGLVVLEITGAYSARGLPFYSINLA